MSTRSDHAPIEERGAARIPRRKRAAVLGDVVLAGVVAVTTAWTSARTAAPALHHRRDQWLLRDRRGRSHIYWTTGGFVGRANLDGTRVNRRFIRTASEPCGVAVYQGHIYWGQFKGGLAHPTTTIGRANLDGSAVNNQFITGIHDTCSGLAVG